MILIVYIFSWMFSVSNAYLFLFFLDFTILLHILAFNNNNSFASLNLSIISDVLLIVHTHKEHLLGHLIVGFGSGD